MGFSVAIANNIRANSSAEYQARIPEATQENFLSVGMALEKYDLLFNEFFPALFNKIGKTYIESLLFKNKLAKYKSGTILSQQDVEEIFVEMLSAEGQYDNKGPNPLGRRPEPNVKVAYHRMNRQDYYAQSIGDIDVIRVFRSEATMDAFITAKFNAMYSGADYDEWLFMKNLLATYDGYYQQEVPTITDEASARDFLRTVRKLSQDITFVSDQYNKAGVKTKTDKAKQVLFINKDVLAHVDVDVLAKSFNMGKTDIQVDIEVMDDFGSMSDTYGLLLDRDIIKVWDTLSKMEPQRNAQGLFTNYFYHVHQIHSMSPFKNAIRLAPITMSGTKVYEETLGFNGIDVYNSDWEPEPGKTYTLYVDGVNKGTGTATGNEDTGYNVMFDADNDINFCAMDEGFFYPDTEPHLFVVMEV